MLAAEVQADLLILMSDVDGIYNKPPWEDGAKLMHTYTSNDSRLIEFGKKSKVSNVQIRIFIIDIVHRCMYYATLYVYSYMSDVALLPVPL